MVATVSGTIGTVGLATAGGLLTVMLHLNGLTNGRIDEVIMRIDATNDRIDATNERIDRLLEVFQ